MTLQRESMGRSDVNFTHVAVMATNLRIIYPDLHIQTVVLQLATPDSTVVTCILIPRSPNALARTRWSSIVVRIGTLTVSDDFTSLPYLTFIVQRSRTSAMLLFAITVHENS